MIYEYFYSAQEIAKILFQGNRTLHLGKDAQVTTPPKSDALRPLSQSFIKAVQPGEDKFSLKSAEEYLSFIGYDARKIAVFRYFVDQVITMHAPGIPKSAMDHNRNFYAGVRILGKSLNTPDTAEALEHDFARRFDITVNDKKILIARKEMPLRKPVSTFIPVGRSL